MDYRSNRTFAMLALNYVQGLGPVWTKRLLDYFDNNPIQVWDADYGAWLEALHGRTKLADGLQAICWEKVEKEYTMAKEKDIAMIVIGDTDYPKQLAGIYDAPPLLYRQGNWQEQDELSIAIVGTRNPSLYGIKQAQKLATELAQRNITVMSGLAKGVDIAAHRGAIAGGGRTIAVLGSGLCHIYPSNHQKEALDIIQHGCLLSEYPICSGPTVFNFPQRNRVISGASLGVVVIEAGRRSGALITAHAAVEQGREVFAVPGQIDRLESFGCHRLIQEGAKLVMDVDDILQEIWVLRDKISSRIESNDEDAEAIENYYNNSSDSKEMLSMVSSDSKEMPSTVSSDSKEMPSTVSSDSKEIFQKKLWEILTPYPQSIEDIILQTDMTPSEVSSTLFLMEIKGLVHIFSGHRYARIS